MTPQEEVLAKLEDLLRSAARCDISVVGFAFSAEPPILVNFGNTTDALDEKLYIELVKMCKAKRDKGETIINKITEVN